MAKKDFANMTSEQLEALTGKDKEAYEKWVNESAEESSGDQLVDMVRNYFKEHKHVDCKSMMVVVDSEGNPTGVMFHGDIKGKNAADNFVRAEASKGYSLREITR